MINFEFKKNYIKVNIDADNETEVIVKFINKALSFLNINSIKLFYPKPSLIVNSNLN